MATASTRPVDYSLLSALVTEVVLTMMFLFVIMGATHGKAPAGFAPIAIGLCLTLIHLVSIPVTNTSVNPARSTGPALFVGGWAIGAALVVLDCSNPRRRCWGRAVPLAQRRTLGAGDGHLTKSPRALTPPMTAVRGPGRPAHHNTNRFCCAAMATMQQGGVGIACGCRNPPGDGRPTEAFGGGTSFYNARVRFGCVESSAHWRFKARVSLLHP